MPGEFNLSLSPDALDALADAIAERVAARIQQMAAAATAPLIYTEQQAAELLNMNVHQLRDLRLRGGISHGRGIRGRIEYTIDDLRAYLERGRDCNGRAKRR